MELSGLSGLSELSEMKLEPMFPDIKLNDMKTPIMKLDEHYKKYDVYSDSNYYSKLLSKSKTQKYSEDILLYYLRCREDAKILIILDEKDEINIKKNIEKSGNFYYRKILYLEYNEVLALFYQIYFFKNYNDLIQFAEEKEFHKNMNKKYRFCIYFYEGVVNIQRNLLNKKYIINSNFNELVLYSKIFLNNNSLDILKVINIRSIYESSKSNCYNTFLKFLNVYNSIDQIQQNNLIISSSFILYLYGLR